MCRYAFKDYKPHLACFKCRKTFKRRRLFDITDDDNQQSVEAKCPQCASLMADMGLDFASPKKTDLKAWEHLKTLYSVGITYHSCGCGGPGYIPNSKEALIEHFTKILVGYKQELEFWSKRIEPQTESEIAKDTNENWKRYGPMPYVQNTKNGAIKNQDAREFWYGRIQEIQAKLNKITSSKD